MASCLSGGGRTYAIDLEMIKSQSPYPYPYPSPSSTTATARTTITSSSQTSSPSSTLSESSNSPLAISTRKPRTARKRPKQTYNEAAALLSTVYPNIFSTNNLKKYPNTTKFTKPPPHEYFFFDEQLLLHHHQQEQQPIQEKPNFFSLRFLDPKPQPPPPNLGNSTTLLSSGEDDFDAESILDEEIELGVDSILGNLSPGNESVTEISNDYWFGNGKMEMGFGLRRGMRDFGDEYWWSFPSTVDVLQISPKLTSAASSTKKTEKSKKKEKEKEKEKVKPAPAPPPPPLPPPPPPTAANLSGELLLKLKYDDVATAWSDKGSPFLDEQDGGLNVSARLAQIDLFSESGGREASVNRYKEKRRTRLFSKKIRYQVRKVNADRRPRMKGRFVRRSNGQEEKGKKKVLLSEL